MKKFYFMSEASGAAVLLLGALAFSACSSDDLAADVNPTYNGETVKTQFAINIPYAGSQGTRMTDKNTQQDGQNFLGMSNIRLIPYETTGTPAAWGGSIDKILALGAIDAPTSSPITEKEVQKIYSDVDIPVGTNNFLFYGEATYTTTADDYKNQGALTATIDGQTSKSSIGFSLKDILESNDAMNTAATPWVTLLNNVKNAKITNGGTGSSTEVTWAEYASKENVTGDAATLKSLYSNYIKMAAGSANSILNLMKDLYEEVDKFANEIGTTDEEKLAYAIKTAITSSVTVGDSSIPLLQVNATSDELEFAEETYSKYPTSLNLPDGAARVRVNDSGSFEANNFTLAVGSTNNLQINNLTYPSSLYYFVDSPLQASTKESVTWPTVGSWASTTWTTDFPLTSVTAETRKIAMKDPVQYGVGLLKTTVKCASNGLIDKGGNTIDIGTDGFTLTGVLIGGQPDNLQWDLYQAYAVNPSRTKTIYDGATPTTGMTVTTTECSANYTLALDNSLFTTAAMETRSTTQDKVNIAIELVNKTGVKFTGADGVVYPGAKFYLVAQLDPSSATNISSLSSITGPSVFMQDYTTTADLTISSLGGAYNTIPDLRSTSLEFGLAVNLEWKTGLSFTVTIE